MLKIEGLKDETIGVVGLLALYAVHVEELVVILHSSFRSPSNSLRRLVGLLEIRHLSHVAIWSWDKS